MAVVSPETDEEVTRAVLSPQVHEAGAHLLFASPDDPDDPGLGRYFGFVSQFDRAFELAESSATFEAPGEIWRFNHNPEDDGPSINYWEVKIRADGQDYDAFYEYNIPVVALDDTHEKKINFQFRPGLPGAKHVDSGNRIQSIPEDLPEGFYIEDDGPVISRDDRDDVLKPGYTTREEGTGFGLGIVRDVAQAHGWNIRVTESSKGGARFEFISVDSDS